MKLENGKTIADSLTPTFENVAREFITDTLEKILFSQKLPNFKFEFREDEAIEFIEKTLQDYRNGFRNESLVKKLKEEHEKILQKIGEKSNDNTIQPVMIVNDYKEFFELLRQFYERDIEFIFFTNENEWISCI